jgi:hypothetical protein
MILQTGLLIIYMMSSLPYLIKGGIQKNQHHLSFWSKRITLRTVSTKDKISSRNRYALLADPSDQEEEEEDHLDIPPQTPVPAPVPDH